MTGSSAEPWDRRPGRVAGVAKAQRREAPPHLPGPLSGQRPLGYVVQAVPDSPRRLRDPSPTQTCTPARPRASRSDTAGSSRWHGPGCRRAQPPPHRPSPFASHLPRAQGVLRLLPQSEPRPLPASGAPSASPAGAQSQHQGISQAVREDPQAWSPRLRGLLAGPAPASWEGAPRPLCPMAPPPTPAQAPPPLPLSSAMHAVAQCILAQAGEDAGFPLAIMVPVLPMGLFCP